MTWKSTDYSTRFWCTENFLVPQKASFEEEGFNANMHIESRYPKASQANSPATTEFFCHNRPPNWEYHSFRQPPAHKLVMRLERRALSTFGRASSRISCFSKPKRCPGSKHFRRDIKPLIVEAKNIAPGATAGRSTTVSIMPTPFGYLVRKVKLIFFFLLCVHIAARSSLHVNAFFPACPETKDTHIRYWAALFTATGLRSGWEFISHTAGPECLRGLGACCCCDHRSHGWNCPCCGLPPVAESYSPSSSTSTCC